MCTHKYCKAYYNESVILVTAAVDTAAVDTALDTVVVMDLDTAVVTAPATAVDTDRDTVVDSVVPDAVVKRTKIVIDKSFVLLPSSYSNANTHTLPTITICSMTIIIV
jgi:hypothetical protein